MLAGRPVWICDESRRNNASLMGALPVRRLILVVLNRKRVIRKRRQAAGCQRVGVFLCAARLTITGSEAAAASVGRLRSYLAQCRRSSLSEIIAVPGTSLKANQANWLNNSQRQLATAVLPGPTRQ